MSQSLSWNRARNFLRNKYGSGYFIKEIIPPISIDGIWFANVEKNGCIVRVEFKRIGRFWRILNEGGIPNADSSR